LLRANLIESNKKKKTKVLKMIKKKQDKINLEKEKKQGKTLKPSLISKSSIP
jgi:hypothetical protein